MLISKSRIHRLVFLRSLCCDFLKEEGYPLTRIGEELGGRHHTTVIHNLHNVKYNYTEWSEWRRASRAINRMREMQERQVLDVPAEERDDSLLAMREGAAD
jgi:chromosomal replication initiation ATPase DnaA